MFCKITDILTHFYISIGQEFLVALICMQSCKI